MNTAQKINSLHELLADVYSQSPHVTTKNTHTENLWREIARLEESNEAESK